MFARSDRYIFFDEANVKDRRTEKSQLKLDFVLAENKRLSRLCFELTTENKHLAQQVKPFKHRRNLLEERKRNAILAYQIESIKWDDSDRLEEKQLTPEQFDRWWTIQKRQATARSTVSLSLSIPQLNRP